MSEDLSRLYRLVRWPEDPWSKEGRARYERALERFRSLREHEWISDVTGRGTVRVLDLCGGTGIGGVALAKALSEAGAKAVELTVADLRSDALEAAKRFSLEELGKEASTELVDAREVHTLGREFDVALIYGYTTPHFSPWDLSRLMASVSESLADDGVLLIEEQDRQYLIFYRGRYKDWLIEDLGPERLLVSVHKGYDPVRGVFKRASLDLLAREGPVVSEYCLWSLANLMTLSWLFFEDVDFSPHAGRGMYDGIVLARRPRRKIRAEDLRTPKVLRESEGS